MSKKIKLLILVGLLTSPPVLIAIVASITVASLAGTSSAANGANGAPAACAVQLPGGTDASGLSSDANTRALQIANAGKIMSVGKQLGVPPRGWVVAIATARQESGLLSLASMANPASLDYPHQGVALGDHDSVGIFQQRDAWGPMGERMDVASSAKMFYTGGRSGERGLLDIPGWQNMSIAEAAQAVQVSAFPSAYAQWEGLGTQLVSATGTVSADPAGVCAIGADLQPGAWTWPVHKPYTLTAGFGSCSALWSHCHTGQDFAVPSNTPVHAVSDGVVKFVGWGGAYGNLTEIEHAGGIESWYAHQTSQSVTVGQHVKADEVIGMSGATGNVTGPHVHLEIRINDRPIDPMPFLNERVGKSDQ